MAVASEYPVNGEPIVRGDPLTITTTIARRVDGESVVQDITGWTWRAQIRRGADGPLIVPFTVEADPDVPGRLLLSLAGEETELLRDGMTFDLEQLTPTHRTWWIVTKLRVVKDVSHDG